MLLMTKLKMFGLPTLKYTSSSVIFICPVSISLSTGLIHPAAVMTAEWHDLLSGETKQYSLLHYPIYICISLANFAFRKQKRYTHKATPNDSLFKLKTVKWESVLLATATA